MKITHAFATLLILYSSSCTQPSAPDKFHTGMEDTILPAFDILLSDSTTYFNTSSLKANKKTVLFYYKPSCPYCRMQMRDMIKNIETFKDLQLCIITYPDFNGMKEFTHDFGLDQYDNIITGIDTGYFIQKYYGVTAIPFTAIFKKNKQLKSAYLGPLSSKFLLKESNL